MSLFEHWKEGTSLNSYIFLNLFLSKRIKDCFLLENGTTKINLIKNFSERIWSVLGKLFLNNLSSVEFNRFFINANDIQLILCFWSNSKTVGFVECKLDLRGFSLRSSIDFKTEVFIFNRSTFMKPSRSVKYLFKAISKSSLKDSLDFMNFEGIHMVDDVFGENLKKYGLKISCNYPQPD